MTTDSQGQPPVEPVTDLFVLAEQLVASARSQGWS
jgi:hypothetical protein